MSKDIFMTFWLELLIPQNMSKILLYFITSCLSNGMTTALAADNLNLQTQCKTFLNVQPQEDIAIIQKLKYVAKFELQIGAESNNKTISNFGRFFDSFEMSLFRGCLGVVLQTDDVKLLETLIKVITSSRRKTELILITSSLKADLITVMRDKPTFDSVIIDTNSSSKVSVTRYSAISSPQWKKLNLSYFKLQPYAYSPKGSELLTGIDIDMWHLLGQHLKLDVNFIRAKNFNTLATNLVDGISDASITQPGFTYARYSKGIQLSRLITQGSLHILATYPGPVDKLQTLAYPFSKEVWILVVLSVALVGAFLLVNKHLLQTRISTYYSTAIATVGLINESLPRIYLKAREKNYSAFIMIFMWLTIGSLISHAYRSILLASLVSVEYESPVDYFQDLLDRNILLLLNRGSILTELMAKSTNPVMREVESETEKNGGYYSLRPTQKMIDMRYKGTAAWLTVPIFTVGNRHIFRPSKEHLPPTKYGFYYRLNMPHIPNIEKTIGHVMDNGVYQYIINKHIWILARPEREYKRVDESKSVNESEPLQLRHFLSAMLLLGTGLIIAFMSEILEWLLGKCFKEADRILEV